MRLLRDPASSRSMLVGLVASWLIFSVFALGALERIREFPGWQDFLRGPSPTPRVVVAIEPTPVLTRAPRLSTPAMNEVVQTLEVVIDPWLIGPASSATPTSMPLPSQTPPPTARPTRTVAPTVPPTTVKTPVLAAFPQTCAQSLPTRFQPGQSGYTLFEVQFRSTPYDGAGTRLATGTRFRTLGAPVCAIPNSYSAEMLFWPVELTSGSAAGRQGWIAESGLHTASRLGYNIAPD